MSAHTISRLLLWIAIVCSLASAQVLAPSPANPSAARQQLVRKLFTRCSEAPSSETKYYLGLTHVPACNFWDFFHDPVPRGGLKDCKGMMELDHLRFDPPLDDTRSEGISYAEAHNGVKWKGILGVNYDDFRVRYVYGDMWQAWGPWQDKFPNSEGRPGRYVIAYLTDTNGTWTYQAGPDVLKVPFFSLDSLIQPKPGCANVLDGKAHAYIHTSPGHLISDSYRRLLEVQAKNKAEGTADDTLTIKFTPHLLCLTEAPRRPPSAGCAEASPDLVAVPGDLTSQLDWKALESLRPGDCNNRPGVEVNPKGGEPDSYGRKKYLSCFEAAELAAVREKLLAYGVEDDVTHNANRAVAVAPPQARIYSGNARGFSEQFPAFLRSASQELGLDPQSFAPEQAYIIDSVTRCAQTIGGSATHAQQATTDNPGSKGQATACGDKVVNASDEVSTRGEKSWEENRDWSIEFEFQYRAFGVNFPKGQFMVLVLYRPPTTMRHQYVQIVRATIKQTP